MRHGGARPSGLGREADPANRRFDILKGLAAMDYSADKVAADAKPANTGEASGQGTRTE